MFGVLNIYKPVGKTSHDVVAILRRLTKIKQIGHCGTLDPFAEGVLPVCIGKATRLIEFFADDKEYLATVQFGAFTTTYDIEGEKTSISDKKVSREDVERALVNFKGEIKQVPPIYSAIKVNGKKLYQYAREGQNVEIVPRKVIIENIELKDFDEKLQQGLILIKCSKGTYIRSIANDLGQVLEVGAYLVKLVRTQVGNFRVENSVQLDNLDVEKNLINPLKMIDLPQFEVDEFQMEKIKNGVAININNDIKSGNLLSLVYNEHVVAIGIADSSKIKLKKVFL
jgi:tRNA pseudouridine55 synthase